MQHVSWAAWCRCLIVVLKLIHVAAQSVLIVKVRLDKHFLLGFLETMIVNGADRVRIRFHVHLLLLDLSD